MYYIDHPKDNRRFFHILQIANGIDETSLQNKDICNTDARDIACLIAELTEIPRGISIGCIFQRPTNKTAEHFRSRQRGGKEIVEYVRTQLTNQAQVEPRDILQIVNRFREVNYTTSEENTKLAVMDKRWQRQFDKVLTHEELYEVCSIKIVPYVNRQRYDQYFIQHKQLIEQYVKQSSMVYEYINQFAELAA